MITILVSLLVGVSGAILLTFTFWAGHAIGKRSVHLPLAVRVDEERWLDSSLRSLRASRALSQRLVTHTDRLAEIASFTPELALEVAAAIDQIRVAAKELSTTLASFDDVIPSKPTPTKPRRSKPPETTSLSRREIARLTPEAMAHAEAEPLTSQRYQFTCTQLAAPWAIDEPFPFREDFQRVKCRDISAGGISFLWPDRPDFDHVIIAIGAADSPIYMAAEILHSKAVYMLGEVGYLVGCKFVKRMAGASWLPYPEHGNDPVRQSLESLPARS